MTQPKTQIQIQKIKGLLASRDFAPAKTLIEDWGRQVREDLKSSKTRDERRRIFEDARTMAQESIYLAQVIRAHIGTELAANSASFLYRDMDSVPHRWQYRG